MNQLSGRSYEELVRHLVAGLMATPGLEAFSLNHGPKNRVQGKSGYRHQIDVSLENEEQLFLLELKCLRRRAGVNDLLVLAARQRDIAEAHPVKSVSASLVSTKPVSRNVITLAKHFGVNVETVEDMHSYAMSFGRHRYIGIHEHVHLSERSDAILGSTNAA
jgi:hypothetical protein